MIEHIIESTIYNNHYNITMHLVHQENAKYVAKMPITHFFVGYFIGEDFQVVNRHDVTHLSYVPGEKHFNMVLTKSDLKRVDFDTSGRTKTHSHKLFYHSEESALFYQIH